MDGSNMHRGETFQRSWSFGEEKRPRKSHWARKKTHGKLFLVPKTHTQMVFWKTLKTFAPKRTRSQPQNQHPKTPSPRVIGLSPVSTPQLPVALRRGTHQPAAGGVLQLWTGRSDTSVGAPEVPGPGGVGGPVGSALSVMEREGPTPRVGSGRVDGAHPLVRFGFSPRKVPRSTSHSRTKG